MREEGGGGVCRVESARRGAQIADSGLHTPWQIVTESVAEMWEPKGRKGSWAFAD